MPKPERLDDAAVDAAVSRLSWQRSGDRLEKTVKKRDFAEAMSFVNAVAAAAESADHHPDIAISWNTVTLSLWTHVSGGITQADVDLAARIDALG
ncbi:MAG TPA: 4a-hydroxytetrahydrobiopterin dehydratase [Acidimicrobiales bacterium]|nr:4a-hydroxytetrahydrobiopterin dehydratase [Acidimicrobiales bacterium]